MAFDVTQLPEDLQKYIQAQIQQAVHANDPVPPRELTAAEKLDNAIAELFASLGAERSLPTGSGRIHQATVAAVVALRTYVDQHVHNAASAESAPADAQSQG